MIRKSQGALTWLEFELFAGLPLRHGVFLRHGGVSQGTFESLNFGVSQGDLPAHVAENKRRAFDALGIRHAISALQVHGKLVAVVAEGWPDPLIQCDGFITIERGKGLLIQHADCQAALFYDPIHHAVANVHCGWRGNVHNIYRETVQSMQKAYGSHPANLLVGISPSLGPEAAEFRNFRTELPESFWDYQVKPTYFNLWEISRQQLLSCGLLPHHIEMAKICTYSTPEDCFSYRRLKQSGRHATLVALL